MAFSPQVRESLSDFYTILWQQLESLSPESTWFRVHEPDPDELASEAKAQFEFLLQYLGGPLEAEIRRVYLRTQSLLSRADTSIDYADLKEFCQSQAIQYARELAAIAC